ncbi:hypothetical protein STBHUCCB_p1450 (plasmid) [Salmonella enterica subsp. enterica serovar Typhi str. P-stx-12]|uniref:Uncharacterized protein n=1 Tax=Escherichia coli TaxID=562 RepID=A0A6G6AP44_ECOLX|nr:hypothetical protein STBHUCCB_p1450 [Salmonella enterica subsp. enterica serovar Typhi str. P-stx-12]ESD35089.1 hypothetical protein HMPREF1604_04601 [Escherichia coli 908519]QID23463.1 hypothetical protein [Escherichia coli]UMW91613.1 hypothetical protein [Escherichia coli]UWM22009.1 hypothetical protein [Morganella morganii]
MKKLLGAFCFLPQSNSESAGWGKSLQHRGYYTTPPLLNEQIVLLNI